MTKSFNVDLGISNLPILESKYPELFREMMLIYNAVNSLATKLSDNSGAIPTTQEELQLLAESNTTYDLLSSKSFMYVISNITAVKGNIARITQVSGELRLLFPVSSALVDTCRGILLEDTVPGFITKIALFGIAETTQTLIPGVAYRTNTSGTLQRTLGAMDYIEYYDGMGGSIYYSVNNFPEIGIALAPNLFYFFNSHPICFPSSL